MQLDASLPSPAAVTVTQILSLQRSAGNAAVGRLLSAPAIQRTLEIDGDPVTPTGVGDHFEEALGHRAFDEELDEGGGPVGAVSPAARALTQKVVNVLKAMAASQTLYEEFKTWDLASKWAEAQVEKLGALELLLAKDKLKQRDLTLIGEALAQIKVAAEEKGKEKEAEEDEDVDEGEEDESSEAEKPPKFHSFKSRADVDVSFTGGGEIASEGKKAGKKTRSNIITKLGLGQHLDAGHAPTITDATLISQARINKKNFKWSSDRAVLTAIEKAAPELARRRKEAKSEKLDTDKDKTFELDISPEDGYGYVQVGPRLYKVFPRRARIVAMAEGDFNTAYGLTDERDPAEFEKAYHKTEEMPAARR